jgi:hypothetical protein
MVNATAKAFNPNPVAAGQTTNAELTADAPEPGVSPGCSPITTSWSWSISDVTLNGLPAAGGTYSVAIYQANPSFSDATLTGSFDLPGTWMVNVVASVTFTDTCGGSWWGYGSSGTSVVVFGVHAGPEGPKFVGAVRDQVPLQLTANPDPLSVTGTYSWSVTGGPGSGTFHESTDQNPNFTGDVEGECTVQVTLTSSEGSAQDTEQIQVIRVDDLSGTVPEAQYDSFDTYGMYTIPYYASGGTLLAVLIQPPEGPGNQWETDFYARVDQFTGDVNITLLTDAPYFVRIVRAGAGGGQATSTIRLMKGTYTADKGKGPSGTVKTIDDPSADLILIDSTNPDDFLGSARAAVGNGNYVSIGNVQDAINAINNKWNNNGNKTFSVAIIGHGTNGSQGMGDGQDTVVGKHIADTAAAAADLTAFTAACKGKVKQIVMYGCGVAGGNNGPAFVQDVATKANCPVTAFTGCVMLSPGRLWGLRWRASDAGGSVTKNP